MEDDSCKSDSPNDYFGFIFSKIIQSVRLNCSVLRTLNIDTEEKYTEKEILRLIAICRLIIDLFYLGCAVIRI